MKILLLDVYKKSVARVAKDTAGGFGTENFFGSGFLSTVMTRLVKYSVSWPNLAFVQLYQEMLNTTEVTRVELSSGTAAPYDQRYSDYDYIFVCSSIVCFETELNLIRKIQSSCDTPIFYCGEVGHSLIENVPEGVCCLYGNYEFLIQYIGGNITRLAELSSQRAILIPNGSPENLSIVRWDTRRFPNTQNLFLSNRRLIPYIATRGCPYSCAEYCTYPLAQGKKVLKEDPESVAYKLRFLNKKLRRSHVVFRDPVFSIDLKYCKDLVSELKKIPDSQTYTAELHLKNLDEEMIRLMAASRFTSLKFGVESAEPSIRKRVKRISEENEVILEKVALLKRYGIKPIAMYIIGQPDDTTTSINDTITFATTLNAHISQFSIFTAYPGTPFFAKNNDLMAISRYENLGQFTPQIKHSNLTHNEINRLLAKAYFKTLTAKLVKSI